jgi:hypothetical protein
LYRHTKQCKDLEEKGYFILEDGSKSSDLKKGKNIGIKRTRRDLSKSDELLDHKEGRKSPIKNIQNSSDQSKSKSKSK